MKSKYFVNIYAVLLIILAVVFIAVASAIAAEPSWWTQQKRTCGLPSNLAYNNWDGTCNSSSESPAAPNYDSGAVQRVQKAADDAAAELKRQAEAERIERERLAEETRQKEADFIRNRDAAAVTLKGSSGAALNQLKGLSGTDSSGLKGSGFDTGNSSLKGLRGSDPMVDNRYEPVGLGGKSTLKGAIESSGKPSPHTDTSVVDARNVPSDLDKSTKNAISKAYPNAPASVRERVRKGFQAIMAHDWNVAKVWFEDALKRDPNNPGLKRLVVLADYTQQHTMRGKPFTDEDIPPDANPLTYAMTSTKIHGQKAWSKFLFPDGKTLRKAGPVFKPLPDGRVVQMPQDSDMEFLFGASGAAVASPAPARQPTPTFIIAKDGRLIQVPEDTDQESSTYIKGKDGKLIEVPQPKDAFIMFQEKTQ